MGILSLLVLHDLSDYRIEMKTSERKKRRENVLENEMKETENVGIETGRGSVRENVREKEITSESTSAEPLVRIQLLHPLDVIALAHRGGIVMNTEHLRGVEQTMGWDPGIFSVVLKCKSQARSARLRLNQQVQAGPSILP